MKVYGDIEHVNLSTGERFRRVSGNGESRLESSGNVDHVRLGPCQQTSDELLECVRQLDKIVRVAAGKFREKPMNVRAKFVCSFVEDRSKTVYMNPVYSGSDENKRFFAATPGGNITLHVLNEAALAAFQQGQEYYVDFTPAA